ncbi:unnamed protein product, partial [Mesorhabditis spiculigera]
MPILPDLDPQTVETLSGALKTVGEKAAIFSKIAVTGAKIGDAKAQDLKEDTHINTVKTTAKMAASAGGAHLGASCGARLGSAFGGVGAVVGTIVGSIVGSTAAEGIASTTVDRVHEAVAEEEVEDAEH